MRQLIGAAGCFLLLSCSEEGVTPDDRPVSAYEVDTQWPVLPAGVSLGKVLAVAVDSRGRVFVTHTADKDSGNAEPIEAPTIFVFDEESGALLDQLGAGLFRYPHGISVDRDDFLWVTDSEANRVYKLDDRGNVLLVLGED
jgi:sugar lactone lactonase YvrE